MNITYLIIMLACLLLSAYFSATETAFSTLSKTKLKTMAEKGNRRAERTLAVAEKYDRLISTILIGNNLVNILFSSLTTLTVIALCTIWRDQVFADNYGATIATAGATIVVLIFGEITPKSIASDFPEKFAIFSMPLIRVLIIVFMPLNALFSLWKKLIAKIFRLSPDNKMSQEELLMLVDEVEEEGTIDEEEGDLLRNAISFGDLLAEDILTHRVDLEAFEKDTPMEEVAEMFVESQFSRLLVYEESIDNIVGVVHQKDIFTVRGITEKTIDELLTPPIFVHKTERIDDLLRDLQTNQSHMAVVLDEYGGTLGIVTMEDILEELVGDIYDEHDEVVEDYKEIAPDTFRVDCGESFEDFRQFFEIEEASESVTVNGWIMEQMDKIPACGDKFTYDNLDITVTETDFQRVSTISVHRREKRAPAEREEKKTKREGDRDRDAAGEESTTSEKKASRDKEKDRDKDKPLSKEKEKATV